MNPEPYISALKAGEIVAFPTETVYGLGASVWNEKAISKIFELKGRPSDNPLIVHISDTSQIRDLAQDIPEIAYKIANHFWPGPLTIILPKRNEVPDLVTAGLNTVAIRMPDHTLALQLIDAAGPLVAPSANISGKPSPTSAQHVKDDFGDRIMILDGGNTRFGIESTVLDLTSDTPVILRPGAVGPVEIKDKTGIDTLYDSDENTHSPKSPGQKYAHYQPDAKVTYGSVSEIKDDTLYLLQNKAGTGENIIHYEGDLALLSSELYRRFREADQKGYRYLHIESIDKQRKIYPSLYQALINRIRKAITA